MSVETTRRGAGAEAEPPDKKRARRFRVGLLLLVCALPYLPSLSSDFVYDDHGQILENTFLRNPLRVRDLVTLQTLDDAAIVNGRRPVALLSYMSDLGLWGKTPFGFHLTNLLLHLAVVYGVYRLVRKLGRDADSDTTRADRVAWIAALCFGVHPVLTEAVHAPAFRPDVLCTGFILLHLWNARHMARSYGSAWLLGVGASAATLLLALGSKETGVVALPLMCAMWLCFPRTRPERGTITCLVAIDLVVLGLFAALASGDAPLQAVSGSWNGLSLPPPTNFWTAPWLWVRYLGLLFWPWPLIVDRVIPPVEHFLSWPCLLGLGALLLCSGAALLQTRRAPRAAFALLWMLLFFLPVSNLLPLINPMAERYLYGMAIGFGILVSLLVTRLPALGGRIVLLALVTTWCALSIARLRDWRDDQTLWAATIREQPDSSRAQTWLALDLKAQGKVEEALAAFERALKMNPRNAAARVNIAVIYGQRGDLQKAEEILRETIRLRPDYPETYWNLAVDLELQGRNEEQLAVLLEGMALNPYHLRTRRAVAEQLARAGQVRESLEVVTGTLDIDPGDAESRQAYKFLTGALRAR